MTREEARAKRRDAWEAFLGAWGVAIIPNLVEAFGVQLDGTGWIVLRSVLAAVWLVTLVLLIVAYVRELRTPADA